jgi:hypothetical protein
VLRVLGDDIAGGPDPIGRFGGAGRVETAAENEAAKKETAMK